MIKVLLSIIKYVLLVCVSSYVGLIVFLLYKENNMLYWGQGGKALMNHSIPKDFQEGVIETSVSNVQFYKKFGDSKLPVVVYLGGNGEHANLALNWLNKEFSRNEVYSINYPGYGKSTGHASQNNIEKALIEAIPKLIGDKKLIIVGRSLGSGFATFLAGHVKNTDKLILITPYNKITDVACNRFFYVPSFICSTFMENQMDNGRYIKDINVPVLVVYVAGDTTIPNENTLELLNKIKNKKVVEVKDSNHNSVMDHNDTLESAREFIN